MQAYFAHWLETEHFNLRWRDPKGGGLALLVVDFLVGLFFVCFFSFSPQIWHSKTEQIPYYWETLQLEAAKPLFMGHSAYETPPQIPEEQSIWKSLEEHTFSE